MEGGDLLQALRLRLAPERVSVIAIAKSPDSSDVEHQRLLDLGATRVLSRPFEIADLVRAIEETLPDRMESLVEETG